MKTVLIPTDVDQFYADLSIAYDKCGYSAVFGKGNFLTCSAEYDLIHIFWPEEFCNWRKPDEEELQQIEKLVNRWAEKSKILITVNNLYPHGHEGDKSFHRLYTIFYQKAVLIAHHSKASLRLVQEEHPVSRLQRNIVTTLFNYDRLLSNEQNNVSKREISGLENANFVILCFGAIRSWNEIILICSAYSRCKIKNKKLLMAGRYHETGPKWRQRFRRLIWFMWLKWINALVVTGYIPDKDVHKYLMTADVVIVPRLKDLSSGLVSLAMTFGKVVIAPDHGAFPDYLNGTANPIYKSGDPDSLAKALEKTAGLDLKKIGDENRKIADGWTWDRIVKDCIENIN